MSVGRRLRDAADRVLDETAFLVEHHPKLARWRARRFYDETARRVPFVGVDAAHGARYFVRPNDPYIGRGIIEHGAFAPGKIAALLRVLGERAITVNHVLDIGANIGTTTVEILRQLPDVTADAFEPDRDNFMLLRINVLANELEGRVRCHQVALTDVDAPLRFELSGSNFGDHRVRVADFDGAFGEAEWETIEVPGRRLDGLDVTVGAGTLVCMDVQGYECH